MKTLIEKSAENNKHLVLIFVDHKKAFDTNVQKQMLHALLDYQINYKVTRK